MLGWIGRHGVVTPEQAARHFFARAAGEPAVRAAQRRLAKLASVGLVLRDPSPYWRSPLVVRLTSAGAKAGETHIAPAQLIVAELRHSLALVDLMEQLAAAHPDAAPRTEREIRTDRFHERSSGARRPGRGRTPDGELTLASGLLIAVELDLTAKRTKDYERILRSYKQERFDQVWWYVLPGVLPRLSKVVVNNRADDFVDVRAWLG